MNIAQRLVLIREAVDLSQKKFAAKIGRSQSTYCEYEKGKNVPERTIADICREFYVNEDWLRTGEGDMFKSKNNTNEELAFQINKLLKTNDEFTKNLFLEYLKSPTEMKTLFEGFVYNLAKRK
ncbi:helix-turn-helix domain-containing protein [Phascolarctobacterium succinatutens]|jgi:HTH-type transcriptional regulator / antitoxin PezA|uniref:helix-turn-helix domain-containing protein n=1 Tax=Phascolarctobacterium succinatutens TaxID=626940 RepID=UPI0026EE12D9|nr:helix-turn-helix transcriptional regulator [Phascolarctobacterium succinatutens]